MNKKTIISFNSLDIGIALMLSAASGLIYEVGATQVLFFYFTESSYSLGTVLSVFLGGLGLGSLLFYKLSNRVKDKKLFFGVLQITIAIYAFFVLTNLINIIPKVSTLGVFLVSALILVIPAIFLGVIFPLSASLFKKSSQEIIGLVYSIDLLGAIAGSLAVGFFLIPATGISFAMLIGSVLNLLSAFIILPKITKTFPVIVILVISLFLVLDNGFRGRESIISSLIPKLIGNNNEFQFYRNSPYGLVAVKNNNLFISGRRQCLFQPTKGKPGYEKADYLLSQLTKKHKSLNILNIGLGCGGTLSRALENPNIKADVVEINPVVVAANKQFSDVLKNKRVNLITDDGLHYLRITDKKYDAILIAIDDPRVAYSSPLYTVEAFKAANSALVSDGTLALWTYREIDVNSSQTSSTRYHDILFYSLKKALPYVYPYSHLFIAPKQRLDSEEYAPKSPYEINTVDKNTLIPFLGKN